MSDEFFAEELNAVPAAPSEAPSEPVGYLWRHAEHGVHVAQPDEKMCEGWSGVGPVYLRAAPAPNTWAQSLILKLVEVNESLEISRSEVVEVLDALRAVPSAPPAFPPYGLPGGIPVEDGYYDTPAPRTGEPTDRDTLRWALVHVAQALTPFAGKDGLPRMAYDYAMKALEEVGYPEAVPSVSAADREPEGEPSAARMRHLVDNVRESLNAGRASQEEPRG